MMLMRSVGILLGGLMGALVTAVLRRALAKASRGCIPTPDELRHFLESLPREIPAKAALPEASDEASTVALTERMNRSKGEATERIH